MIKGLINTLNQTLYIKYKKRTQLKIKKKNTTEKKKKTII